MTSLRESFLPVYSPNNETTELGDNSMLIGGSLLYLQPDEDWPLCNTCAHPLVPLIQLNASSEHTPLALRTRIPSAVPANDSRGLATMVQLFVCPETDCYDTSTNYSTETRSWVVRIATVPLVQSHSTSQKAKKKIEDGASAGEGTGFLPPRIVETWRPGKKETFHWEVQMGQDDSDEFYDIHEPVRGLKLLGHSVRGKFYCSEEVCPQSIPNQYCDRRELIQIGDRDRFTGEDEEENGEEEESEYALGIMATLGNTWIEQCIDHPEVLTLTMSGNW
ncbi:hypothetical protein R3P38DRAFT_2820440 [Favolaschia claudopus]|uniref:Programmed cell death protein 2 C-terminal domain-containing protein n=1 Tax=Favolaschia claudopus TaxID=2862362 RepID=A0AAW0EI04_9AGAR